MKPDLRLAPPSARRESDSADALGIWIIGTFVVAVGIAVWIWA